MLNISEARLDETFEGFDKANGFPLGTTALEFISRQDIEDGMRNFLNRHGIYVKKSLKPHELASMIFMQVAKMKKDFKEKAKANFAGSDEHFDNYEGSDVYNFEEKAYIDQRNREVGFDNLTGSGGEYENFAVGAALKVGKGIAKKVIQKVKEAKAKKNAQNQLAEAQTNVQRAEIQAPKVDVSQDIINRIKDAFKLGINDYKEAEKAKEINKMIPTFILVAVVIFAVGYFVAKK